MIFSERRKTILSRLKRSYVDTEFYDDKKKSGDQKIDSKNIFSKLAAWLKKNGVRISLLNFLIIIIFCISVILMTSVFFKAGLLIFILSSVLFISLTYISVDLKGRRINKRKEDQLENFLIDLLTILYINPNIMVAIQKALESSEDPIRKDFNIVIDDTRRGIVLNDALSEMLKRNRSRLFHAVITGLIAANEKGVDLIEFIKSQIAYIREKKSLENYVRILSSGPRYTSYLIIIIPLIAVTLASFINQNFIEVLLSTTGKLVLIYSSVSYLIGFFLINRITGLLDNNEKGIF
jgi:tight adherence protein B